MGKISVVINTLNEEKNLPKALISIENFADEIVVVDMHSDDKTKAIARKYGANIFEHERTGYVEPARNFAISKATGDWILILDADEEITPELKKRLKKILKSPEADFYRLPRKNMIFGKWMKHSRWWPDYNIRFFRKGKVSWNELIHSVPMTVGKGSDLEAKEELAIVHNHYESVEQFIGRLNKYTSEQALSLSKENYKFTWADIINKPAGEFLSRYFFGEGYKDGLHGLALAGLQAFSEFVKYLKVWQLNKFPESEPQIQKVIKEIETTGREFRYWHADVMLKTTGNLKYRIRRKLKI